MINFDNVSKQYPNAENYAVRELNLHVDKGEFLILLGESGCGKTTALKLVNRLLDPTGGVVEVDGQNVATVNPVELRRGMGYVIQSIGLFPHMTVAENVAVTPRLLNWEREKIRARVDEVLDLVNLPADEYRNRYPSELSGGQQQRVGVARGLASGPKVMLLDEPFGALDPITRDSLQREFMNLQKRLQLTAIMVTHDMTEALLMGDRIAVMQQGSLLQCGSPNNILNHPEHEYVATLMRTAKEQADRLEALAHANGNKTSGALE